MQIGIPARHVLVEVRQAPLMPAAKLFACESDCRTLQLYSTGWALLSYLINEHFERFNRYLQRLNELPYEQHLRAWQEVFPDLTAEKIDRELPGWVYAGAFKVPRFKVHVKLAPATERLLGDADVLAVRSLLYWIRGKKEPSVAAASAALTLDRKHLLANQVGLALGLPRTLEDLRDVVAGAPEDWRAWTLLVKALQPGAERSAAEIAPARWRARRTFVANACWQAWRAAEPRTSISTARPWRLAVRLLGDSVSRRGQTRCGGPNKARAPKGIPPIMSGMEETETKKSGRGGLLWLLPAIALVAAWWCLRPAPDAVSRADARDAQMVTGDDPDDILVDLKDDVSDRKVAEIGRELGIDLQLISDQARDERFYRAKVAPARRDAVLAALEARPDVELAEPDSMMFATPMPAGPAGEAFPPGVATEDFPNDPQYKFQWHMRQIGMPEAWKLADGNGVDRRRPRYRRRFRGPTRSFYELPDLKGIDLGRSRTTSSPTTSPRGNDDHGHGSHVTGTIAQVTNNGIGVAGIARNVKIMPLKVLSSASGSGSVAGIADAIRYAADNGAKVINMSARRSRSRRSVLEKAVKPTPSTRASPSCARPVTTVSGKRRLSRRVSGRDRRRRHAERRSRPRSTRTGARRSTSRRRAATPASIRTTTACPTASCRTPS